MNKNIYTLIALSILILVGCSNKEHEEQIKQSEAILIEENEENLTKIYNYIDGYTLTIDNDFSLDTTLEAIRTRLYNKQTIIDIFYDDFKGTIDNQETYMNYANRFIEDRNNHTVLQDERKTINGKDVHLLRWTREKLKHVENDKNHYLTAEIAKNKYEIYTIMIKSTEEIKNEEKLLKSFDFINQKAEPTKINYQIIEKNWNQETDDYYQKTFINNEKLQWGLFDASHLNNLTRTKALEQELQYKFSVLLRYQIIGKDEFPKGELESAFADGRITELTLQHSGQNDVILYKILNGDYDDYLNRYAQGIREFGHPILFRLNNEMNGDWVTYSSYHASKDTDLYIEAWRYIYRIFENNHVDNAIWIWNPNHHSKPNFKWNHSLMYYPGSEYVDIVGLTAYNTGTYYEGENWTSFKVLYDEIYNQYVEWFDHPFMITEFASSSVGGDKIKWMNEMFSEIDKYERVKVAVWWSWQDLDANGNPARIYFLDENEETKMAFKRGLQEYR